MSESRFQFQCFFLHSGSATACRSGADPRGSSAWRLLHSCTDPPPSAISFLQTPPCVRYQKALDPKSASRIVCESGNNSSGVKNGTGRPGRVGRATLRRPCASERARTTLRASLCSLPTWTLARVPDHCLGAPHARTEAVPGIQRVRAMHPIDSSHLDHQP